MTTYDRTPRHLDGSLMFTSPADEENERSIAVELEEAWRCQIRRFGKMTPIDFYAVRDGRLCAVVEVRTRTHATSTYPTVFLGVRKWLSLMLAENGLGLPALYVVRFTDETRWIRVSSIDASAVRMGGRRVDNYPTDTEPVVLVPIDHMRRVHDV